VLSHRDQLETGVEDYLVRKCKDDLGVRCLKITMVGRRGAPDRFMPAINTFVETKRPKGGVLEDHQVREHERLRKEGYDVRVIWTKEQVDQWLEERFL